MAQQSRRSALGLGVAALLAACRRPLLTPTHAPPMHPERLAAGWPALAARARPGVFAFGVMCLETTELWCSDRTTTFPLAGAVALPIAAAALAKVDDGTLSLDQRIAFDAGELSPPPSYIDGRWPTPPDNMRATIALRELLRRSLVGDNTAIDLLMRQAGGPGAVGGFLAEKNQRGFRVDRYIREALVDLFGLSLPFRPAWKDEAAFEAAQAEIAPADRKTALSAFLKDPRDTATVPGALGFLASLHPDLELISVDSTLMLLRLLDNGRGGGLRDGWPYGGYIFGAVDAAMPADLGVTPASTALGFARGPDATPYALAAFLTNSPATDTERAALFADATRLAAQSVR